LSVNRRASMRQRAIAADRVVLAYQRHRDSGVVYRVATGN
jgi:hypothetical protein